MSEIFNTLSQFSNNTPNDFSNYANLLKENIELSSQKKELLSHIKRNEDLLFKAQKIIISLREEMSLQESSNKSRSSQLLEDKNVLDLQDKLYISNKNLQETLIRINENNSQMKLLNEQNLKLESELHKAKKELEASQKILKKFTDYHKNQEKSADFSINKLMEENFYLKEKLSENSYSLLKQAENKIENLELNITKIEENSLILPEIEQKFLTLQCQTSQKFNLIQKTAVYISNQFETALQNLPYSKNDNFEFNFFELNEKELNKLDKNLLATLKKFDFSLLLQNLFKSFCEEIIGNFEKKIEGKIFDYLSVCESKIQKISSFISIIEMKMDMKKESLEKRMIINGKKNDSDFKNCTFEKKRSFIDDNKENLYTGNRNLIKINEKNCFEDCLKKMGEYRGFFQKFNEDISLILKEFSQSKILKSEDVKKLKYELESKNEIFKELEIFITNIIGKSLDFVKTENNLVRNSKHLPLRI